jgi:hypothetical protein
MVYREGEGFVYEEDFTAVKEPSGKSTGWRRKRPDAAIAALEEKRRGCRREGRRPAGYDEKIEALEEYKATGKTLWTSTPTSRTVWRGAAAGRGLEAKILDQRWTRWSSSPRTTPRFSLHRQGDISNVDLDTMKLKKHADTILWRVLSICLILRI